MKQFDTLSGCLTSFNRIETHVFSVISLYLIWRISLYLIWRSPKESGSETSLHYHECALLYNLILRWPTLNINIVLQPKS